jgi:hypothetical protein
MVDTNIGPSSSSDNGVNANLLGSSQDSGALVDADAGQTQQAPVATVNAGTNADQFQFPALGGTGADSLVGETGQLAGDPVSVDIGDSLLPASAQANDTSLSPDPKASSTVATAPISPRTPRISARTPRFKAR